MGSPPLSATFSRARGKVESPIHGEQFQANRNAMIEDKWCNGEHNNGPCSGRNNEDRQRELNHNEDDLNYEILPRDIFPLGLSPFSRKIFQTRPIFLIMILLESINSKRKSFRSFFGYLFRNVQI